jgi:AraC family transcriptional regulator
MVAKGGLAKWKKRSIRDYIDVHLESLIRMESLYTIAGLSKGHFHKAFLATFGTCPGDYINRRRVKMACRFLEETDEPIAQIAVRCGYADQPHFGKRFLKGTGYTPKQWRMEYGGSNANMVTHQLQM